MLSFKEPNDTITVDEWNELVFFVRLLVEQYYDNRK
jgi:hypothetical protein